MTTNLLFIACSDGTFEVVSDQPVVAYLRDDRPQSGMIPVSMQPTINVHEFSREISGVEVARYSAEDVASWILVNQTAKEAMVDAALRQAEEAGLICGINRDHATIIVTFDKTTSDWYCYLEFEEDV